PRAQKLGADEAAELVQLCTRALRTESFEDNPVLLREVVHPLARGFLTRTTAPLEEALAELGADRAVETKAIDRIALRLLEERRRVLVRPAVRPFILRAMELDRRFQGELEWLLDEHWGPDDSQSVILRE